jgi:hypothetical protein
MFERSMDAREKQIPAPRSWQTFEDLCLSLFKSIWSDPLAQKNGRAGQAQQGVDVFGSPAGNDEEFFGVQCKGKDQGYGSKATVAELERELAKAETFVPGLSHWVFATTAPTDARLQEAARRISAERVSRGGFPIRVLGWEDICGLLIEHRGTLDQFYPELGIDLGAVASLLRGVSSDEVRGLRDDIKQMAAAIGTRTGSSPRWRRIQFNASRDLGPALLGRSLGPSDVAACPTLPEAVSAADELRKAYSARLEGQPGAGKSVCAWQTAKIFSDEGWRVYQLADPRVALIEWPDGDGRSLCLIDDAHLTPPETLAIAESETGDGRMLLTTHNAVGQAGSSRGAIVMDPKRAVRVIAAELRRERSKTLAAVSRADKRVGDRPFDESLDRRLDHAEQTAVVPWQFCFILGGGEARATTAADAARTKGADLVLAAIAIRQMASRDARPQRSHIEDSLMAAGVPASTTSQAMDWLVAVRLVLGPSDLRTPHQRFASVVLRSIMKGLEGADRKTFGRLMDAAVSDPTYPLAGVRLLLDEVSMHRFDLNWRYVIDADAVTALLDRCWAAEAAEDRTFAMLVMVELHQLDAGWPETVLARGRAVLPDWFENPADPMGYGIGRLVNTLRSTDAALATSLFDAVRPGKIAAALSGATPETAFNLGEMVALSGSVWPVAWKDRFREAVDRQALLALGRTWPEDAWIGAYGRLAYASLWFDETLALDMVEAVLPRTVARFRTNPVGTFHELDDVASYVLKMLDVLGAFKGRHRPQARHRALAAQMCSAFDPATLAGQLSATRKRDFQQAGFLLSFIGASAPKLFEKTVCAMDFDQIGETIGADWANLFHESEVLLGVCCRGARPRAKVEALIERNVSRIEVMPARIALIAPKAAYAHLEAGKPIQLGSHWSFAAGVLAHVADERKDLLDRLMKDLEPAVAKVLTTGPARDEPSFVLVLRMLKEAAPVALDRILSGLNHQAFEDNLEKGLKAGGVRRRTAAIIIDLALSRSDGLGVMARSLRTRFPAHSIPSPKDLEKMDD